MRCISKRQPIINRLAKLVRQAKIVREKHLPYKPRMSTSRVVYAVDNCFRRISKVNWAAGWRAFFPIHTSSSSLSLTPTRYIFFLQLPHPGSKTEREKENFALSSRKIVAVLFFLTFFHTYLRQQTVKARKTHVTQPRGRKVVSRSSRSRKIFLVNKAFAVVYIYMMYSIYCVHKKRPPPRRNSR